MIFSTLHSQTMSPVDTLTARKKAALWEIPSYILNKTKDEMEKYYDCEETPKLNAADTALVESHIADRGGDLRRGDVVHFEVQGNYRCEGIWIYNGSEITGLYYDVYEYGSVPREYTILEFSCWWWFHILPSEYLWFDQHQIPFSVYEENLHIVNNHWVTSFMINGEKSLFTAGYEAVMHIHTAIRDVSVLSLISEFDRKTKRESKHAPHFARVDAIVTARLSITTPVCMELFEVCPQLGRFIIRDKGRTIAIGKIIAF